MFEDVVHEEGLETAVTLMMRSRFYPEAEVFGFFQEIAEDDPDVGLDPETIGAQLRTLLDRVERDLFREESTWTELTDNDRLARAFVQLNESGVRAVENLGYTASDAGELYAEIRNNPNFTGYCFYHSQDLVRVLRSGKLMLRYSAAVDRPTDEQNKAVAEKIASVLRSEGLEVEWDGDPGKTIAVTIDWKRRQPGRLQMVLPPEPQIKPWWKFW